MNQYLRQRKSQLSQRIYFHKQLVGMFLHQLSWICDVLKLLLAAEHRTRCMNQHESYKL